jgi:hypothetical protein
MGMALADHNFAPFRPHARGVRMTKWVRFVGVAYAILSGWLDAPFRHPRRFTHLAARDYLSRKGRQRPRHAAGFAGCTVERIAGN